MLAESFAPLPEGRTEEASLRSGGAQDASYGADARDEADARSAAALSPQRAHADTRTTSHASRERLLQVITSFC
jgi:hypothetical protein